jgi:hypothetical protein
MLLQVGAEHQEFKKLTDVCSDLVEAYTSVTLTQPFDTMKMLKSTYMCHMLDEVFGKVSLMVNINTIMYKGDDSTVKVVGIVHE